MLAIIQCHFKVHGPYSIKFVGLDVEAIWQTMSLLEVKVRTYIVCLTIKALCQTLSDYVHDRCECVARAHTHARAHTRTHAHTHTSSINPQSLPTVYVPRAT
jgi:hypothetical protein